MAACKWTAMPIRPLRRTPRSCPWTSCSAIRAISRIETGSPHPLVGLTAIRKQPRGSGAPSTKGEVAMQASERDVLKERHRYSEWAGHSTAPSDRSVRRFMFTGDELPGYRLDRVDRREAPEPARVTGFWRRADTNAVVRIDVFECATLNAAHDYLIDALNEFESGAIGR